MWLRHLCVAHSGYDTGRWEKFTDNDPVSLASGRSKVQKWPYTLHSRKLIPDRLSNFTENYEIEGVVMISYVDITKRYILISVYLNLYMHIDR